VEQQTGLIRESEERFRHLAHHDPLTGLPNRALLHIRLDAAIEQAKLDHTSLALLMMDLDGFKQVNDTLGHDGGDQMLCAAAKRIVEAVRRSDTVARMGGDEFIVLLCGLGDASEAREIAAKILLSLSAPLVIGTHCVPVSGSIGICTFPDDGEHASTLLKNADTAMYQAKALGRNRFQRYTPELSADNFSTALMLQTASSGYRVH
jgi:diguanylate cyclase (GGDEF)-like protein